IRGLRARRRAQTDHGAEAVGVRLRVIGVGILTFIKLACQERQTLGNGRVVIGADVYATSVGHRLEAEVGNILSRPGVAEIVVVVRVRTPGVIVSVTILQVCRNALSDGAGYPEHVKVLGPVETTPRE